MSFVPTSTPLPFPILHNPNGDASPEGLLDFLRNLISKDLGGDPARRIPATEQDWVTVVIALTDSFLASFPTPDTVAWDGIRERIALVDAVLDLIHRVTERVDGIFTDPKRLADKLFVRLLDLCVVLEAWLEVDVSPLDVNLSPLALRTKANRVIIVILRSLGSSSLGTVSEHLWKQLRRILIECLDIIRGA